MGLVGICRCRIEDPSIEMELSKRRCLDHLIRASGELELPGVPAEIDKLFDRVTRIVSDIGCEFTQKLADAFRERLLEHLERAHRGSCEARVNLKFRTVGANRVLLQLRAQPGSTRSKYWRWHKNSDAPFGSVADARVLHVAHELSRGRPLDLLNILDIGAGPGRNALPLARLGHRVDALEATPRFCFQLHQLRESEGLPLRVLPVDFIDEDFEIRANAYDLIVLSHVLADQRSQAELGEFLNKISRGLRIGGRLLASSFVSDTGSELDDGWRELAYLRWSAVFSQSDFDSVLEELPLSFIACEPVLEYERDHCPAEEWPPTRWFESWSRGRNVFGGMENPPMRNYWIQFERVQEGGVKQPMKGWDARI